MELSAAACCTSCHNSSSGSGTADQSATNTRSCYLVRLRWRTDAVSVGLAEQHACLLLLVGAGSSACMDIPRGRLRSWLALITSPTRLILCTCNVACRSLLLGDNAGGAAMLCAPPPSAAAAVLGIPSAPARICSGRAANETCAICAARKAHYSTLHHSAARQPTTVSSIEGCSSVSLKTVHLVYYYKALARPEEDARLQTPSGTLY